MNKYVKGDRVLLFADFLNKAGVATTPTATVTTIAPNETAAVNRGLSGGMAAGRIESEFTLSGTEYKPGVWYYRIEGTGAVERAFEGWFELLASKF
jgi:hypothetical protein